MVVMIVCHQQSFDDQMINILTIISSELGGSIIFTGNGMILCDLMLCEKKKNKI